LTYTADNFQPATF